MESIQNLMNELEKICVERGYGVRMEARFKKKNNIKNFYWKLKEREGN